MKTNRDLVVLVADKDAEQTLSALLPRDRALGIRKITFDVFRSPDHDPGVASRAEQLLRLYLRSHGYALAILDLEGSGRESTGRADLESEIEAQLGRNGWEDRCAAIAIAPELEAWMWSPSPEVGRSLGWTRGFEHLRGWLMTKGVWDTGQAKPSRPKEAYEAALREARKARSAAIFRELSGRVAFDGCRDPSFRKLVATLQRWFAPPTSRAQAGKRA